ncbi:hypothetical protein RRG08_057830 [Elysia crispata]|uniref:Uncharacterized protein n=1 Tax=Elysia crispata TaxID=231223 RepID=A0AAE1AZM8_9GAST|nr:hypothetical protein RRG08_057830 [Elysia crispata]
MASSLESSQYLVPVSGGTAWMGEDRLVAIETERGKPLVTMVNPGGKHSTREQGKNRSHNFTLIAVNTSLTLDTKLAQSGARRMTISPVLKFTGIYVSPREEKFRRTGRQTAAAVFRTTEQLVLLRPSPYHETTRSSRKCTVTLLLLHPLSSEPWLNDLIASSTSRLTRVHRQQVLLWRYRRDTTAAANFFPLVRSESQTESADSEQYETYSIHDRLYFNNSTTLNLAVIDCLTLPEPNMEKGPSFAKVENVKAVQYRPRELQAHSEKQTKPGTAPYLLPQAANSNIPILPCFLNFIHTLGRKRKKKKKWSVFLFCTEIYH